MQVFTNIAYGRHYAM